MATYKHNKTITFNGEKMKLTWEAQNFTRETNGNISEFDVVINGINLGHAEVPFSNVFKLNGVEFSTEKAMLEYAYGKTICK